MKKKNNEINDLSDFKIYIHHNMYNKNIDINYPNWRIKVPKKEIVSLTWINRKTLNTLISRWKIEVLIINWNPYIDLINILVYLRKTP